MSIFWAVIIAIVFLLIGVLAGVYLNDYYGRHKRDDGWLFIDKTPGGPTEIYTALEKHPIEYVHGQLITLRVSVENDPSQQKQGS